MSNTQTTRDKSRRWIKAGDTVRLADGTSKVIESVSLSEGDSTLNGQATIYFADGSTAHSRDVELIYRKND